MQRWVDLRHDRYVRSELLTLEAELRKVALPLELPGVDAARKDLGAIIAQLHDYLIPRFEQWDAPILIVVGGSTGAGKSTLVNALVGEEVSAASAIRPTTRLPLLVHNPADAEWFHTSSILPGWVKDATRAHARDTQPSEPTIQIRTSEAIPAGLAIIDAPDIDSLEASNRERARELFDVADAWIFATTAMRYADAVPWEYIKAARERNAVIMLVLGRTSPAHVDEVRGDLESLLAAHGLGGTPVFVIDEKPGDVEPKVSAAELAPIKNWLAQFSSADTRDELIRQTAVGATENILNVVEKVDDNLQLQRAEAESLAAIVRKHFTTEEVSKALASGELLRGEVLRQWHEFLGTGEYLRRLESGVSKIRDRISRLWRRPMETNVQVELGRGFVELLTSAVATATRNTWSEWERHPAGKPLLRGDLALPSDALEAEANEEMREWQAGILELVREHGSSKRTGARMAAYGVNAVGLALMILAFASTGGLLGAEVAIAGGTAVLAQRVLEAIFGEHGMRELAAAAQDDLLARTQKLFSREAERFTEVLPEIPEPDLDAARLAVAAKLAEVR